MMFFLESIKMSLIDKFFCFKGKASKQEYIYFSRFFWCGFLIIPVILFLFFLYVLELEVSDFEHIPIYFSVGFVMLTGIPHLSLCVRRLHDVGESGWLIIPMLLLGIIFLPAFILWYHDLMNKPSVSEENG